MLEEFERFLKAKGVEHPCTIPPWPQANGEMECQAHSLLNCVQVADVEGHNWRFELVTWLSAYWSTTGASPFSLMFGREKRTRLPKLRRETVEPNSEGVCERACSNNLKGKAGLPLIRKSKIP